MKIIIIQNRSKESILDEIEDIKDKVPGFTGTISDLGVAYGEHVPV